MRHCFTQKTLGGSKPEKFDIHECLFLFVLCHTEAEEVSETADQLSLKAKRIYLVDSGLAFNSPYPLLLRPERDVDIFLSFDFSARKKDDESPFQVNTLNIELVCKTRTPKLHIPGFHTFLSVECFKSHFVAIKKLQIPRF